MRIKTTLNIEKDILEKTEVYMKEKGYKSLPFLIEQYLGHIALEYEEQDPKTRLQKKRKRITALKEQLKDIETELTALEAEISAEEVLA